MTAQRLFTQAELDAMCRSPKEQMAAVLESGGKEAAKQKYAELEDAFLAFHDIYYHWVATIQEFIYERYGHDGLAKAAPLGAVLAEALKLNMSVGEVLNCSKSAKDRMVSGVLKIGSRCARGITPWLPRYLCKSLKLSSENSNVQPI